MTPELEILLRNDADKRRLTNQQQALKQKALDAYYQTCLLEADETPIDRRLRLYVIEGGKK